jgi:hypothetical protein
MNRPLQAMVRSQHSGIGDSLAAFDIATLIIHVCDTWFYEIVMTIINLRINVTTTLPVPV